MVAPVSKVNPLISRDVALPETLNDFSIKVIDQFFYRFNNEYPADRPDIPAPIIATFLDIEKNQL